MIGVLFPGQGDQEVGMCEDILQDPLLWLAEDLSGYPLRSWMSMGPKEMLIKNSQIITFVTSIIRYKSFDCDDIVVGGLSVGELSALCIAGCYSFSEGLRLVMARQKAMEKCCHGESMAAVLGAEDYNVEKICQKNSIYPANYNYDGQLVISGNITPKVCEELLAIGAKKIVMLNVMGAFHSPFMNNAVIEFSNSIPQLHTPKCDVYQNINALPTRDVKTIKKNIIAQINNPVLWKQMIRNMITNGITTFIDLSERKTLSRILKKIDNTLTIKTF